MKYAVGSLIFSLCLISSKGFCQKLEDNTPKSTNLNQEQVFSLKAPAKLKSSINNPTVNHNVQHIPYHESTVSIHAPNRDSNDIYPEALGFYPIALKVDNNIITYIAGTPVVTFPYTGDRPAFDGSDYIVNISSINRDIRLMQQRRALYRAYEKIGYPAPVLPILAISGKTAPLALINDPYRGTTTADLTLGGSELDFAGVINRYVESFMSVAYGVYPQIVSNQRIGNANFNLDQAFINIGDLDQSPFYFTAGQLYIPFGKYSSSLISSALPLYIGRTKARPFIIGYKSMTQAGPFAAGYIFKSDTSLGKSGVGGANLGYIFKHGDALGEIGAGYISSITDAAGLQVNGSIPFTTFGGFASLTNGSEQVAKVPGVDIHANVSFDRYSLTGEWVSTTKAFRPQDLSYNNQGARLSAGQLEAGVTFKTFNKPSSFAVSYQWSKNALALNIPRQFLGCNYSISLWKNTVESIEFNRAYDYPLNSFANGSSPTGVINQNIVGTGKAANTVLMQIMVYF